jgi:hypothetical protein
MDSPEEVYRLLSATSATDRTQIEVQESSGHPVWHRDITAQFINRLPKGSVQVTFIRELYHGPDDGLSLHDVMRALDMSDPQQLGGVLSGLAKNAKKLGAKSPIEIERTRNGKGERTYIYRLEPLFKTALEEIDKAQPLQPERDLPEFRDYIRVRRAALFGFMEQGARLAIDGNRLEITPRNDIYVRYLSDNLSVIAEYATECYKKPIEAILMTPAKLAANAQNRRNDARPIRSGAPRPQIPNGPPVPRHLR